MNYFDDPNSKHFSFQSFADGTDEATFGVINFKGYEAISKTYDFEIMLVSSKKDIDLEDMLQAQAVFTIHRGSGGDDDVLYNGILAEFDQLHEVNDVIFYRARLVPKLWWLTLTHHNQVFLEQSIPDIVEDALRDGGLETEDFDISALSGYEEHAYVCQYDESHFNFVSRSLERQGIYYYFAQEDDGEVLTLTDTKFSHDALKEGSDLFYNPASGLEGKHLGEAVGSFTCRQKQLPAEIILKDYNYERPSLDITSTAEVDPVGRGISYLYGEYFATPEEGERLATIRAEELLCKKQEFFGESTVPYIMPGFTFNLNNHYREDFNQEYLILEVTHEGNQSHLMSGGIASGTDKSQNQAIYHNSFKAIPNETQFRPDRITEKPKISGTIHAKIDSEVDSEYAQIDEQGRYHVKLPFDINDEHMDGKGSAPVRMMQSYAGKERGMQFPLVKGTEVLLTFIEGNPDRPVIAGAVSNPETQGPVSADNQTESVIRSGGNNRIRMGDEAGQERIVFETPNSNSWIRMGCHNDPITLNGSANVTLTVGDVYEDQGGVAIRRRTHRGQQTRTDVSYNKITNDTDYNTAIEFDPYTVGTYVFHYEHGGNSTTRRVDVVEDAAGSTTMADSDGIRIRSGGSLWMESGSRYGDYKGMPSDTDSFPLEPDTDNNPAQIGNLLNKFATDYDPSGLLDYKTKSQVTAPGETAGSMEAGMAGGDIQVSSLDTFTTQEGNIYDFGGYWNYNLGNSYAENHMDQDSTVTLNEKADYDLLNIGGPHCSSIAWPESDLDRQNIAALATFNNDLSDSDTELPGTYFNADGSTRLWIEKKFGHSYEYTEGDTISVSKGNSLEVTHGGTTSVEVKYSSSGKATYWSKSSGGITNEKKWVKSGKLIYESTTTNGISGDGTFMRVTERNFDRNTGDICSYSSTQGTGMGKVAFNFDYANNTTSEFTFGLNIKAVVNSSLQMETATNLAMFMTNSNYIGGQYILNNYVGYKMDLNFCAGVMMKVENSEYEVTFPGTKIKAETNKIDTKANDIKALANSINTMATKINAGTTDIETIATVKLTA